MLVEVELSRPASSGICLLCRGAWLEVEVDVFGVFVELELGVLAVSVVNVQPSSIPSNSVPRCETKGVTVVCDRIVKVKMKGEW